MNVPNGSMWLTTGIVAVISGENNQEFSHDLPKNTLFTVLNNNGTWLKIIANQSICAIHSSWWPTSFPPAKLKRIT